MRFIRNIYLRYNPKQYLKHIIIEVIIVAVGILLAFQLDAWKDNRAANEIQLKTLKELNSAIEADLREVSLNDTIHTEGFNSSEFVLKALKGNRVADDSLTGNFFTILYSYSLFLPHTAAYETLKSRGLETIRNDSLRLKLIEIYDQKFIQIEKSEADLRELIFNDLFTYFKKNFVITESSAVPIDYNFIKKDKFFLNLIGLNRLAQHGSAVNFRRTLDELNSVHRLLESEIENME